jgi:hypothetical protein
MTEDIEEMFAELDEKMKRDWRLRWHYRWYKLRLDISEFFWSIRSRLKDETMDES